MCLSSLSLPLASYAQKTPTLCSWRPHVIQQGNPNPQLQECQSGNSVRYARGKGGWVKCDARTTVPEPHTVTWKIRLSRFNHFFEKTFFSELQSRNIGRTSDTPRKVNKDSLNSLEGLRTTIEPQHHDPEQQRVGPLLMLLELLHHT